MSQPIDQADLIEHLKTGMTKDEVLQYLRERQPGRHEDLIQLDQMNWVGFLRNLGFIIPKKRGYYQITGFQEPEELKSADLWPEEQQEAFRWFRSLPKIGHTQADYQRLRAYLDEQLKLVTSKQLIQQLCPGYVLSYELANDDGRYLPTGGIVAQKFKNQPRFRVGIPKLDGSDAAVVDEAVSILGKISRRDVKVTSVPSNLDLTSRGYVKMSSHNQGFFSLLGLANDTEFISNLPSRKRSTVRKNLRELTMVRADRSDPAVWRRDGRIVLDTWRKSPSGLKQRQLAIGRDYVALDMVADIPEMQKTAFLFYRYGVPNGLLIFDRCAPTVVADLVSKAINYPEFGGYHNTHLAMFILSAKNMSDQGIEFSNDGDITSGTEGLAQFKGTILKALGTEDDVVVTYDWSKPGTTYVPDKLEG